MDRRCERRSAVATSVYNAASHDRAAAVPDRRTCAGRRVSRVRRGACGGRGGARVRAEPARRPGRGGGRRGRGVGRSRWNSRSGAGRSARASSRSSSSRSSRRAARPGSRFGRRRSMEDLKARIRHVPDFPKAGILFYDVTTLLRDPRRVPPGDRQPRAAVPGSRDRTRRRASRAAGSSSAPPSPTGSAPGSCPSASWGSCPSKTVRATYDLEYGTDSLEMHRDAIEPGQRVLIVDDLLATGGTARATVGLVKELGRDRRRGRVPHRARGAERPRTSSPARSLHVVLQVLRPWRGGSQPALELTVFPRP